MYWFQISTHQLLDLLKAAFQQGQSYLKTVDKALKIQLWTITQFPPKQVLNESWIQHLQVKTHTSRILKTKEDLSLKLNQDTHAQYSNAYILYLCRSKPILRSLSQISTRLQAHEAKDLSNHLSCESLQLWASYSILQRSSGNALANFTLKHTGFQTPWLTEYLLTRT